MTVMVWYCWLVVELGAASQEQRPDRTVERSKKRESERTKRKGGGIHPKLLRFQPLIFIYVIKFSIG
jgi:hypothetical protein